MGKRRQEMEIGGKGGRGNFSQDIIHKRRRKKLSKLYSSHLGNKARNEK